MSREANWGERLLTVATSLCLVALALVNAGSARSETYVLYARTVSGGADWTNPDGARYEPNPNCDNSAAYASNAVRASTQYLNVTSWVNYDRDTLLSTWPPDPQYEVIEHVYLNVNGRYDDVSSNNRFIVRLQGSVVNPPWDNAAWAWAQASNASCAWRFGGGDGWEVTSLRPQGWGVADVEGLSPGFRRNNNTDNIGGSTARINAVRVVVVTGPTRAPVPVLSVGNVFKHAVDLTWSTTAFPAQGHCDFDVSLDNGQTYQGAVVSDAPSTVRVPFCCAAPGTTVMVRASYSDENYVEPSGYSSVEIVTPACLVSGAGEVVAETTRRQLVCGTTTSGTAIRRLRAASGFNLTGVPPCGVGACDIPGVRDAAVRAPIAVRVAVHLMRHSDGSGGASAVQVDSLIAEVNRDLKPYQIALLETVRLFHDDDRYAVLPTPADEWDAWLNAMKTTYALDPSRQLNMFISEHYGQLAGMGTFPWQPEARSALGGLWVNAETIGGVDHVATHEMGHCLGLYHTFHGVELGEGGGVYSPCFECSGVTDVDVVGDLCGDTRPTPMNFYCSEPLGCDERGAGWAPTPLSNFMGYSLEGCRAEFTEQQVQRMHCWARSELGALLQDVTEVDPHAEWSANGLSLAVSGTSGSQVNAWFTLPAPGEAVVSILDVSGRKIAATRLGHLLEGRHGSKWDGRDRGGREAPAGIYFYRLEWSGRSIVRRFALVR